MEGLLSTQVAQEVSQLRMHYPLEFGVYPKMQVVHLFPEHYWHLSGQGLHFELTIVRPGAQEVHLVILLMEQLEQDVEQPRQVPLTLINPLLQA